MPKSKTIIKWTPFAIGCHDDIYDYIFSRERSARHAIKFINLLMSKVEQLEQYPESGQMEPFLAKKGQNS